MWRIVMRYTIVKTQSDLVPVSKQQIHNDCQLNLHICKYRLEGHLVTDWLYLVETLIRLP